jgi:hypothetical protein
MFENNKIFINFCNARNLKNSTIKGYESALKLYTNYHNENLDDLLNEAFYEENKEIILKNRKIKNYLIDYRGYLLKNCDCPKFHGINEKIDIKFVSIIYK